MLVLVVVVGEGEREAEEKGGWTYERRGKGIRGGVRRGQRESERRGKGREKQREIRGFTRRKREKEGGWVGRR